MPLAQALQVGWVDLQHISRKNAVQKPIQFVIHVG
jgi:hypothetical protein